MRRALEVAAVLAMAAAVMLIFGVVGFAAQSRSLDVGDGGSWAATNGERVMSNQFQRFQ